MNHTILTLIASFCLSSLAYQASQDQVDVLEFLDPIVITPRVISFEETEIQFDDGDTRGIDWDRNEEFWCATHPDECLVDTNLQDDDDDDSDEEFGC